MTSKEPARFGLFSWRPQQAASSEGVSAAGSATALQQIGVESLVLVEDARGNKGVPVIASDIDDLSKDPASFKLWDIHESHIKQGEELPESIRRSPLYAFPARGAHWDVKHKDYLRVTFTQPTKVYVMLVNKARVPDWVQRSFNLMCKLQVEWHIELVFKMVAVMTQKLDDCYNACLDLYESSQVYEPGVPYHFGGMGGTQLLDYMYVFMWQPLTDEELLPREGKSIEDPGISAVTLDAEANRQQRAERRHKIMQAVKDRDFEELQFQCRAYRALLAQATNHGPPARDPTPAQLSPARAPAVLGDADGSYPEDGGTASQAAGTPHAAAPASIRPSFVTTTGRPLTMVAVESQAHVKVILYLVSQGAELDEQSLSFVLANAKALPSYGYQDVSHLGLSYIYHQRNPIACAMVFAQKLREVGAADSTKADEFRGLALRLRTLAVRLVEKLDKLITAHGEEDEGGEEEGAPGSDSGDGGTVGGGGEENRDPAASSLQPTTLEDVLAPHGKCWTINDASPLQVAYETTDELFMSSGVVQRYRQQRWHGAYYAANSLVDNGNSIHYRDNRFVLRLLENTGFVGSIGRAVMAYFSYMAHVLMLSSRPFFDSPRGRWAFHLLSEAFFLYVFHAVQLMRDETRVSWQHVLLVLYVAGMFVDELQEVAHQYDGRLAYYFADGFNVSEAAAMLLLVSAGACKSAMFMVGEDHPAWSDLRMSKEFLFNTAPILLWMRTLQCTVPLVPGLGALLMIISKMVRDLLRFAVLGLAVMMGVAFTLYATFRDRNVPDMDSFASVLLRLFRTFLGETMFDVLRAEEDTLYNLYGNIVTVGFVLAGTVVLANLLIAILTYHFKPPKVEAQSRFQDMEILQHYEYKVKRHLLGAPFSLPLLVLEDLLPSGQRPMMEDDVAKVLMKMGLNRPDGNRLLDGTNEGNVLPTGSHELPYLVFLLTAYPLLMAVTWALALLMAPYCIAFFALKGCNTWLPEAVKALTIPGYSRPDSKAGRKGGAKGDLHRSGGSATASTPAGNQVAPEKAARAGYEDDGELLDALEEDVGPGGLDADWPLRAGWHPLLHPHPQQEPAQRRHLLDGLIRTAQHLLGRARLLLQVVLYLATRPLAAAVGAAAYLVLLLGLILVVWQGVYTWLARLAFSCYCVLGGWAQGWFGLDLFPAGTKTGADGGSPRDSIHGAASLLAQSQAAGKQPRRSQVAAAREYEQRWVRVNQAELRNRGQVLSKAELEEAMLAAGFRRQEVMLARMDLSAFEYSAAAALPGNRAGTATAAKASRGAESRRLTARMAQGDGAGEVPRGRMSARGWSRQGSRKGSSTSSSSSSSGSSSGSSDDRHGDAARNGYGQ